MSFWQSIKFWLAKGVAEMLGAVLILAAIFTVFLIIGIVSEWRKDK